MTTSNHRSVLVADVANKGLELSFILNALNSSAASNDLSSLQLQLNPIARGVSLHSFTLKEVGKELSSPEPVHSEAALHKAEELAREAKALFEEIGHGLSRVQQPQLNGSATSAQLFEWYFKSAKVAYLLAALESLNLSMSLLLQIIQIGKTMAHTSKNDTKEEVAFKKQQIGQERLWAKNLIFTRSFQIQQVDHLYEAAERAEAGDKPLEIEELERRNQGLLTNGIPQFAIEAPPDDSKPEVNKDSSATLVKLPVSLLGALESRLESSCKSPKEMLRASEEVIDPLLEIWTIWHKIRENRHEAQKRSSGSSNRYAPSVQPLDENDEQIRFQDEHEREESPHGYFLEGETTNWRQPHSAQAMQEAAQIRKRWSGYQASASQHTSEEDDSPSSRESRKKKKAPRRHIIDSGSSESASEDEYQPPSRARRTSDGNSPTERRSMSDAPPLAHSYSAGQAMQNRMNYQPPPPFQGPRVSMPNQPHLGHRPPFPHAATTTSVPPITTTGPPNPYVPTSPYGPQPPYAAPSQAYARYAGPIANRLPVQQAQARPVSRDGKARSPSRLAPGAATDGRSTHELKREKRPSTRKNLREGAAKGLLGAGAIAGFLEALEGLSL